MLNFNSNSKGKSKNTIVPDNDILEKRADIFYPDMNNKKKNPDYISADSDYKEEDDDEKQEEPEENNNSEISNSIKKELKREDILYPTMEDKNDGTMTGGAANFDNTEFSDEVRKKARVFIGKSEGFRENAYKDIKGVWTIGYGHTKDVKPGDKITKEEAEKLYAEDFKIHSAPLKYVKVPLNDNEKIALTSLIYNIGETQFKNSTVLKKLNEGDKKGAADAMERFCKTSTIKNINGKIIKEYKFNQGLYNRRLKEKELFLNPEE